MEIEIRTLAGMRLVGVRHRGPYWEIGAAFERLREVLDAAGLPGGTLVAVYHDDPTQVPLAQLRSDACVEVADPGPIADAEVSPLDIPAGEYACGTHTGPYSELPQAWSAFFAALPSLRLRPAAGPSFEIYRSDCAHVEPESLVTELYHPVLSE